MARVRRVAAHHVREQVGREFRESVERYGRRDDEARHDQQTERNAAPGHLARERATPSALAHIEDEPRDDADDPGRDQQPTVLHRRRHEGAASEPEHDHSEREKAAERGKRGPGSRDQAGSKRRKSHDVLLRFLCGECIVLQREPVGLAAASNGVARLHVVRQCDDLIASGATHPVGERRGPVAPFLTKAEGVPGAVWALQEVT